MNVNKMNITIVLIMSVIVFSAKSQTTLNLYPINNAIGLRFFAEKKFSMETRIDFQLDLGGGENNIYLNPEIITLMNFWKEQGFQFYAGLGIGASIYNQSESQITGSIPIGTSIYFGQQRRIALVGECGVKMMAGSYLKLRSYATVGLQIRLRKTEN